MQGAQILAKQLQQEIELMKAKSDNDDQQAMDKMNKAA